MIKKNDILAIIPVRKGSKRLPGKNTKLFAGEPLFVITLKEALNSKYIDHIVVSTDCPITKKICKIQYPNIEVIDRPEELATDKALSLDVIKHVLSIKDHKTIVLLQATSPLRDAEQIDIAIENFMMHDNGSLVSGYFHNGKFKFNGAIYINDRDVLQSCKINCYNDSFLRYPMSKETSIDIDTKKDFKKAEMIYNDDR